MPSRSYKHPIGDRRSQNAEQPDMKLQATISWLIFQPFLGHLGGAMYGLIYKRLSMSHWHSRLWF